MDLFAIDFDGDDEKSDCNSDDTSINDDGFADMTAQADAVIKNEQENPKKRAEACVKKFQLLKTRHKLAPKLLEKALELYPDMPQALTNMGRFYLHTKNRKKAIEYFDKAADADPSYPYVWLEKAHFGKDREEQICFYSEFIKLKPNSKIGYEKRVWLYEEKVLENMSRTIRTLENDGLVFSNTSIIRLAINDYSKLIRLDPSNWEYYESRARMHLMMSKMDDLISGTVLKPCIWTDALMDIEQLMLLYPADDVCNCITIICNIFTDLSKKATIEYVTQIIDDLPLDSVAHLIAQILLAKQYEYDESEKAIEIYSKIINSLKDGDLLQFYCFYHRAWVYIRRKEFEKALADNAMIIRHGSLLPEEKRKHLESSPYYARINRVTIYKEMNDLTGAINEYTLLLEELNNTDDEYQIIDPYFERAILFMKNGESDKALADYSAVIGLGIAGIEHSVKDAYAARIEIYKTRGEMDKAFADYIKMSELKNEDNPFLSFDMIVPQKFEILDE